MEKIFTNGNKAVSYGAIAAGMRYYFGYPITPQNDILEFFVKELPKVGGKCVQAESELAAINMVFGAAAAGGVTMTTSSSPGVSLMQEGISYLAGAHLPAVILNVVRGGPGLGNIQPSQSDYFQSTRGGGHGDYYTPTYLPNSIQEQYDLAVVAFRTAWKYLHPVMIQTDGMLGQMMEPLQLKKVEPLKPDTSWAATGKPPHRERNIIRSLFLHPEDAVTSNNEKLQEKYRRIEQAEQMWESYQLDDAEFIVCGYGIVSRVLRELVDNYRQQGIKAGLFRPITGFPFPIKGLANIKNKKILVVELSYGQMVQDVKLYADNSNKIEFFGKGGGWTPSLEELKKHADTVFEVAT
jgi:2-oxoglutarate ferredoxin oxidoreductase subunit alpha